MIVVQVDEFWFGKIGVLCDFWQIGVIVIYWDFEGMFGMLGRGFGDF